MQSFLQATAADILERFGTNLHNVIIVFPNKRAGLFLNKYLATTAGKPLWAPRYMTISELFSNLSHYILADEIMTICQLYNVYSQNVPQPETLDRFYEWGRVMLSDFDDIDKHMVDSHQIFRTINSIHELENKQYLTPEQQNLIKRFFSNFSTDQNSIIKENFLKLWNKMDDIYTEFNRQMRSHNMLYEGALYKDVIQNLPNSISCFPQETIFLFVGFNVLNQVEKKLFHFLLNKNQALFYWDYDILYVNGQNTFEAGIFIQQNLKEFPNALPKDCFDNLSTPPRIDYISATSQNAQARYVPHWLQDNLTTPEHQTAIVLCNENLLQSVIHSLPDQTPTPQPLKANITMGYPLKNTPAYSFLCALLFLQIDGYSETLHKFRNEQIQIVLRHPYATHLDKQQLLTPQPDNKTLLAYIRTQLEQIAFSKAEQNNTPSDFLENIQKEALFQVIQILCRFINLIDNGILKIQPHTLSRLLRSVVHTTTIPFHGEPAEGLQIMGVLETRNLNFKRILMLSTNEGMMPKAPTSTSFIPHTLREAFGLTTIRQKIAVYAYYFYRLLQHAEHITYLFDTSTGDLSANEMSRFLRQILAETNFPIRFYAISSNNIAPENNPFQAIKTPEILDAMYRKYSSDSPHPHPLSPSAINAYLDCPLKFFFQQIAKIRIQQDPQEGINGPLFGTLFHDAAFFAHQSLTKKSPIIQSAEIKNMLQSDRTIEQFVEKSFLVNVFNNDPSAVAYNGQHLIVKDVLIQYLKNLLNFDLLTRQIDLVSLEQVHYRKINVQIGDKTAPINVGGKIDRIDIVTTNVNGTPLKTLRIIDYKTSGHEDNATEMTNLFASSSTRKSYSFQTFLYSWVMREKQSLPIAPVLLYVNETKDEQNDYVVQLNKEKIYDFAQIEPDFDEYLQATIDEIFNPQIPFRQTEIQSVCAKCDYKQLCGRNL